MIEHFASALWQPWLFLFSLLVGLLYSLGSGFFPLFGWNLWIKNTLGKLFERQPSGGISSAQALATALASTIGTGSIAGVASALSLGGPGAIFWMWVTALLGMMTSCGEKILTIRYQHLRSDGTAEGGPMYYLRDGLHAPVLAAWFSLCCIPAAFVGGNLIQASSIADALQWTFGADRLIVGLLLALLSGVILFGGIGRIARFSTILVPVMAILYLGGGLTVLILNRSALPGVFRSIFQCALSPSAAFGGAASWSISSALRHGVARSIFASEAGLGTSAIAHGCARVSHPARQGMWGILEVFCTTFLVCTITALTILVAAPDFTQPSGAHTTAAAFQTVLGPSGGLIVTGSLLLFAFSSILGWSYYGQQALHFLTGSDHLTPVYRILFLCAIPLGCMMDTETLWSHVDLWNGLMSIPNLIGLTLLAPEALKLLRSWTASRT